LFAFQRATLGPPMPPLREDLGFGYNLACLLLSATAAELVLIRFSDVGLV
jgi:hypothetical protein